MPSSARSPSRWLAPLALVACVIAVLVIVSAGPSGSAKDTSRQEQPAAQRQPTKKSQGGRKSQAARTYTVQAGDTLSGIAAKAGVSLERIQQLNPTLDSQALQTGQTVKLGP